VRRRADGQGAVGQLHQPQKLQPLVVQRVDLNVSSLSRQYSLLLLLLLLRGVLGRGRV
jgi:hypothetical protein